MGTGRKSPVEMCWVKTSTHNPSLQVSQHNKPTLTHLIKFTLCYIITPLQNSDLLSLNIETKNVRLFQRKFISHLFFIF